jgi:hypothetical protein
LHGGTAMSRRKATLIVVAVVVVGLAMSIGVLVGNHEPLRPHHHRVAAGSLPVHPTINASIQTCSTTNWTDPTGVCPVVKAAAGIFPQAGQPAYYQARVNLPAGLTPPKLATGTVAFYVDPGGVVPPPGTPVCTTAALVPTQASGQVIGHCTVTSRSSDADELAMYAVYTPDEAAVTTGFAITQDRLWNARTSVQTYIYSAYTWTPGQSYSQNFVNNQTHLLSPNPTSTVNWRLQPSIALVAVVSAEDEWGIPAGAQKFVLSKPAADGSELVPAATPLCTASKPVGGDYTYGRAVYACTLRRSAYPDGITMPAIRKLRTVPPTHGVYTYNVVTAPFESQSGWNSAATPYTEGQLNPPVPAGCSNDITNELQTPGSSARWKGLTWDGSGGCFTTTSGIELTAAANANTVIKNAAIYYPKVEADTNPATGAIGGFHPAIRIAGVLRSDDPVFDGANNVKLSNISIVGADQSGKYFSHRVGASAIQILSSRDDNLDNVTTYETWGDSLTIFRNHNNVPATTNLNICNDGTTPCAYVALNAGRQGISPAYLAGPDVFTNTTIHQTGEGNAWDFESDASALGIMSGTVTINNTTVQGLILHTEYIGPTASVVVNNSRNNTFKPSGAQLVFRGGFGGGSIVYNGGSYSYPDSLPEGIRVANTVHVTLNGVGLTAVPVYAHPDAPPAWNVTNGSSLTLKSTPFPPPAGTNDATSTVTIIP